MNSLTELSKSIHQANKEKGFWEPPVNFAEKIALIHSECSELLEAHRKGEGMKACDKNIITPNGLLTNTEEEIADIIIRALDLAGSLDLDIGVAITAKLAYNATRPHKHGKAF